MAYTCSAAVVRWLFLCNIQYQYPGPISISRPNINIQDEALALSIIICSELPRALCTSLAAFRNHLSAAYHTATLPFLRAPCSPLLSPASHPPFDFEAAAASPVRAPHPRICPYSLSAFAYVDVAPPATRLLLSLIIIRAVLADFWLSKVQRPPENIIYCIEGL